MTMMQRIYQKLASKNLNPFFIGQHKGECTENYCIVKEGTQSPFFNSKNLYKVIEIIIFVPADSYVAVEPYKEQIISAMAELRDIRKTGTETPVITDDVKKAYTMSIEYQLLKSI